MTVSESHVEIVSNNGDINPGFHQKFGQHDSLGCQNPRWTALAAPRQLEPNELIPQAPLALDPSSEITLDDDHQANSEGSGGPRPVMIPRPQTVAWLSETSWPEVYLGLWSCTFTSFMINWEPTHTISCHDPSIIYPRPPTKETKGLVLQIDFKNRPRHGMYLHKCNITTWEERVFIFFLGWGLVRIWWSKERVEPKMWQQWKQDPRQPIQTCNIYYYHTTNLDLWKSVRFRISNTNLSKKTSESLFWTSNRIIMKMPLGVLEARKPMSLSACATIKPTDLVLFSKKKKKRPRTLGLMGACRT